MGRKKVELHPVDHVEHMRNWDPNLHPEWRLERVIEILDDPQNNKRISRRDDEYIKHARSFIAKWRTGSKNVRQNLKYDMPGMYFAQKMFDDIQTEPNATFTIEAMLLAGMSDEEIASKANTEPPAVEWYEAVFFNVRPRLKKNIWILNHVLVPAVDRFADAEAAKTAETPGTPFRAPPVVKPHFDMTLKFFAYFGGPVICEYMLSKFKNGVIARSVDDIGDWLDDCWAHAARARSTQAVGMFEINRYNVMELFAVHNNIIATARGLKDGEARATEIENHIYGMMADIAWTSGDTAKAVFNDTSLGRYDEMAAELRDSELQCVGAGIELPSFKDLDKMQIPLSKDKDVKNANRNST